MMARAVVVVCLLAVAAIFSTRVAGNETPVDRQPLSELPYAIGEWRGREAAPFSGDVVAQLGVDDYIHRSYVSADGVPLALYAGYYASQRQGDTIHSPQNCLPGAGWRPVSSETISLDLGSRVVPVNKYVIEKGRTQQVVLYWYHGRGRVVANEYANKALLMWDAARLRRTNGGLVRLIAPQAPGHDSTSRVVAFATSLVPHLERVMP